MLFPTTGINKLALHSRAGQQFMYKPEIDDVTMQIKELPTL